MSARDYMRKRAQARRIRSEAQLVAEVLARLLDMGVLRRDPAVIARAASVLDVEVAAVRDVWRHQERLGWLPPAATLPCPMCGRPLPEPGATYCSSDCQRRAFGRLGNASGAAQASASSGKYKRANPAPGMKRCARCEQVKPVEEFKVKNPEKGWRWSYCSVCLPDYHRQRYLSNAKREAMDAAGVTFVLAEDEADLVCANCGLPLRAGESVTGSTHLAHSSCANPKP